MFGKNSNYGMAGFSPFGWMLLLCLTCIISQRSTAQGVKRIYLANDDHTDYMWTADEARYDTAFVKMLDYYLDQIEATKSNPPDFQARFNCDGSVWIRAYEKYRSPERYKRLIEAIRTGHISSPLNFLVSTYGAQPTEAVLRGMYHAGQLERDYGLRFPLAVCMENQTLPLGLSSLWAGSGAKYSWRGVCGCASRLSNASLSQRRHQLYNYTGLDNRQVMMKWYNRVIYNGRTLGGYAECRREKKPLDPVKDMGFVVADLDKMCDTVAGTSRYPFNAAAAFGYGWDDIDNFNSEAFVNAAKAYTNKERTVRVSNEQDFFEDVQRSYPHLPSESVSYGNEWDTYCATMNETTAKVRRAIEKLRSAEALYAFIALKNKAFGTGLEAIRKQAWEACGFYWEHDWTADSPTVPQSARAAWQVKICNRICGYTDTLFALSQKALGQYISSASASQFYVFNPLGWMRDDVADILYEGPLPVKVTDLDTKKEVKAQPIVKEGKSFIRIWAEQIPSVGYKVFQIQPGNGSKQSTAARFSNGYFSNRFYRIGFRKSGVITELFDSMANRQLVAPFNGRYLNDLGGTAPDEGGDIVIENEGPVSVTLKAVSDNPVKHTVRITLFSGTNNVVLEDSIQQNFRDVKTWAFSFNLKNQTTRHEELGAILTARKETRGGHYAAQNARYDWQTFNHFADMSEADYGITLSNTDCSFFKLGAGTPDSLWEDSPQLNALAGGQLDRYTLNPSGWKDTTMMGIYNQGGQKDFYYRFALASHAAAFDPVRAMKISMEQQNPFVTGRISGGKTGYPSPKFSLIHISDPAVLLWAFKPAEEGIQNGLISRFWNIGSQPVKPVISFEAGIKQAWQTSHIETNEKKLGHGRSELPVSFNGQEMNTYRIIANTEK